MFSRWSRAIGFSLLAALAAFAGVAGGLAGTTVWTQLLWGVVAATAAGALMFLETLAPAGGRLPLALTGADRTSPSELPALPHGFVDRRLQIAQALRVLRYRPNRAPQLVVTGLPGVGKTAFALVVASLLRQSEYPGPLIFLRLSSGEQPGKSSEEVVDSLLVALGRPRPTAERDLERRRADLTTALDGQRALIVLDGATSESQLQEVDLPGGCAAIVTSTGELKTLRDRGAQHIWLSPLTDIGGLRFLARRELLGTRRVAREPRTALRIVRYCGGLPQLLMVTAGQLRSRAGQRGSLRDAFRLQAASRAPNDNFWTVVDQGLAVAYEQLANEQRRAFQVLGVLDGIELDPALVAAALETDTLAAERVMAELVNRSLVEPAAERGDRWRLHDLVARYARTRAEHLPAGDREAIIRRTLPVFLRRVKTLGELITPEVRRLYPELAALAQIAIDREWANATAEVDATARAGLDLLACLTGATIELLLDLVEWPAVPGAGRAMGRLLTAAHQRDAQLYAQVRAWFERHPHQQPDGSTPPTPADPPAGPSPTPSPPAQPPARSRPSRIGPDAPAPGDGLPPGQGVGQPPSRPQRRLRGSGSAKRRWLITGWAVGFAPQTPATLYVDGKKVATLEAHTLAHIRIEVHSTHPPRQIYIDGTGRPNDPPPRSSFSVQELPPW